jgi:hypothetical protein
MVDLVKAYILKIENFIASQNFYDAKESLLGLQLALINIEDLSTTEIHKYRNKVDKFQNILYRNELLKNKLIQDLEQKTLDVLHQTRQTLTETEVVVQSIAQELTRQSETINKGQENVEEIHKQKSYSNSLLTKMSKWWR